MKKKNIISDILLFYNDMHNLMINLKKDTMNALVFIYYKLKDQVILNTNEKRKKLANAAESRIGRGYFKKRQNNYKITKKNKLKNTKSNFKNRFRKRKKNTI